MFKKSLSLLTAVTFVISSITPAAAQSFLQLPPPGTMVAPSSAFRPAIMAGVTLDPANPMQFNFIISGGDNNLQGDELARESAKLINYFLAALTVPEDELWVNLSPYEENRIVAEGLGQTEMGRDMLAQDYLLKQFTASLMYPEEELGATFWQRIKEKTEAKYGNVPVPTNTFNKVWIVPQTASVYVHENNIFVAESYLKVMLEEDYVSRDQATGITSADGERSHLRGDEQAMSAQAKEVIREMIIPEIEREVNEGKNFANLRQIYNSMILATWYKKNLRESILGKIYMDANKVAGIEYQGSGVSGQNSEQSDIDKIYNQYVEAFKVGVYDYIKEDYDPQAQEVTQKKYFSGGAKGVREAQLDVRKNGFDVVRKNRSAAMNSVLVELPAGIASPQSAAMTRDPIVELAAGQIGSLATKRDLFLLNKNIVKAAFILTRVLSPSQFSDEVNLARMLFEHKEKIEAKRIQPDRSVDGELDTHMTNEIVGFDPTRFSKIYKVNDTMVIVQGASAAMTDSGVRGQRSEVSLESAAMTGSDDSAMTPGGIDFNPSAMDLQTDGAGFQFDLDPAMLESLNPNMIDGLTPVIINITPIPNYLPLLGFATETEEEVLAMAAAQFEREASVPESPATDDSELSPARLSDVADPQQLSQI